MTVKKNIFQVHAREEPDSRASSDSDSHPDNPFADPAVAAAVLLERRERESRAEYRLDQLRGHLITSFKQKQAKTTAKGQKLSTRTQSAIKRKADDIKRCKNLYMEARRCLIKLGMDKTDPRFQPLHANDLHAYDTTSLEDLLSTIHANKRAQKKMNQASQRAVLGQHHVSWLWENWSFVESGNLTTKVRTYFLEGTLSLHAL